MLAKDDILVKLESGRPPSEPGVGYRVEMVSPDGPLAVVLLAQTELLPVHGVGKLIGLIEKPVS